MQFMITRVLRYIVLGFTIFCLFLASLFWYCFSNDVCSVKWLYIPFHNRTSSTFYWRKLRSSHQYEIHSYVKMENFVTRDNSSFPTQGTSYDKLFVGQSEFDIKGSDVIVFLHIQNTGGSVFSRHIIEDLSLERPCHCRKNRRSCVCYRPNKYGSPWLFSRYTMGWKCGVHPDWTELSSCVDRVMDEEEGKPVKRRYFFITVLRDPLKRFLSEFWHSKQGQNWPTNHWCEELDNDLPSCFDDMNAMDLSLDDFMACPYNLAINRQTRMLSDMSLIGCYNSSLPKEDVDLIMFASAKSNLHKMAFFGLSEFPKISQYMFETSFNLNFRFKEQPLRNSIFRSARKMLFKGLNTKQVKKIKHINNLDVELYQYAKKLLFYRFEKLKNQDPSFENNFQEMNEKNVYTEDWADKEDLIDSHNS